MVSLDDNGTQNVYIAPDSVAFINLLGSNFTSYFDSLGFDWKRLAGAKVLQIGGIDAYDYVDHIASTVSGNYLDHGIRVNSVYTSYRISRYNSSAWISYNANFYERRFGVFTEVRRSGRTIIYISGKPEFLAHPCKFVDA